MKYLVRIQNINGEKIIPCNDYFEAVELANNNSNVQILSVVYGKGIYR